MRELPDVTPLSSVLITRGSDRPHIVTGAILGEGRQAAACHEGHEEAPAVIVAMGVPRQEARGTVVLSLGRGTTRDAVERAAAALAKSWRALAPAVVS